MAYFQVVSRRRQSPVSGPKVLLIRDKWNDWFVWITMFSVVAYSREGTAIDIGYVKIGERGMVRGAKTTTELPEEFDALDERYFSLGQTENYYETLRDCGEEFQEYYLKSMRDIAYDLTLLKEFAEEPVLTESLMRDMRYAQVAERYSRLSHGNSVLTEYSFSFRFPTDALTQEPAPLLEFDVRPNAMPPTNVHALIGRNGVGKTRCFDLFARALLGLADAESQSPGELTIRDKAMARIMGAQAERGGEFSTLISVSFSAFDALPPLRGLSHATNIRYAYIGLKAFARQPSSQNDFLAASSASATLKNHSDLSEEFAESVMRCREGARARRWRAALTLLEADPLFAEADVSVLAAADTDDAVGRAIHLFGKLSSGHGIVLLTITRLVELVEERTLILMDEPESHLHPPLLSAFVRALSDLLTQRNGVAIVATHSPVVLQEVPRSCVWILSRSGHNTRADRPEIETFGENVGTLTREVFGLEVTQSGFHRMIADLINQGVSYDDLLQQFDGQLGAEARALARALSM